MQHATPPLMLCGLTGKARDLARSLGTPAHLMCDAGHAAGRRLRDYGGFGDAASAKNALLIECGQPRRIAARATAARIAQELKTELGGAVGYKIRFNGKTSPRSYISGSKGPGSIYLGGRK